MSNLEVGDHLDNTSEITVEAIKSRAIKGILTLTSRTIFVQAVGLASTIFLTIFLTPSEFGVFFLISAVVNFLAYFGDIGLAAALIQKKDKLTDEDLKSTFTIQQVLVLGLILIVIIIHPLLISWYKLSLDSITLLWALTFSLLISSLKTIPTVILERKLDFTKMVIPQMIETLLFNVIAVYLAWNGFGINSFTIAVLIRSVAGLALTYYLQPWMPGIAFSKKSFNSLFKFGLPYQMNTFLAVLKDEGTSLLLSSVLGTHGFGLLSWAQKWAFSPLRFFMDQVIKVTFPAFSRLQDDKKELSKGVSLSLLFINLLVFPSLIGLVIIAPALTEVIPKYEKWQPALLALSLISVNSALAAVTTPLVNTLNAIGKVKITFRLMIMWTVLTWLVVPFLTVLLGLNGAALGFMLVGLSSFVAIAVALKYVTISIWNSIGKPAMASIIMGVVMFMLQKTIPTSTVSITTTILLGFFSYALLIFLLGGNKIFSQIKQLKNV